MPAYPIPPWLKPPPDPGEEYVQAFHTGAAISGEQARMNQQALESQTQLQIAQQQHQRESMMEQQRMEIAKQQHQMEMALNKQKLDQAAQLNQSRIQDAATRFAARQQYEKLVAGGMDPVKASLQVGPALFPSAAGWGQLVKSAAPKPALAATWVPADPKTGAPGYFSEPSGVAKIPTALKPDTSNVLKVDQRLRTLQNEEKMLLADPMSLTDPAIKAQVNDIRSQIHSILRQQGAGGAPLPPTAAAPAAPSAKGISIVRDKSGKLVVSGGAAAPAAGPAEAAPEAPPPPAPKVSFDQFLSAIKEKRYLKDKAVNALADQISDKVGYSGSEATRVGTSTVHRAGGMDFAEALVKGKSSRLPGLTGKDVEDWLNRLPEEERNRILATAMQQAGLELPK